jgi:hypothetical protein
MSVAPPADDIDRMIEAISIHRVLTPAELLSGNFDIIAHSHNIIKDNDAYTIR